MGQPGMPGSQFRGRDDTFESRRLEDLARMVQQFSAANILATAGIGVIPNGVLVNGLMQFKRADGTVGVQVDPTDGTFTAFSAAGDTPVARFGALINSNPGQYGVEILYNGAWVQVGAGNVDWGNISNKPATFTPSSHNHPGSQITSRVPSATDAIGSASGFANNVMGTEFYALWVGNDGSFSFGRNTSSIRYKENVRDAVIDPDAVLQLRPTIFDRKAQYRYPEDETGNRVEGPAEMIPGAKDEYGLIAEEVLLLVPELVQYFNGDVDGVRYERGFVALLPVVQRQAEQIAALQQAVRDMGGNI